MVFQFNKKNKSYIHIMDELSEEIYFFNLSDDFNNINLIELFEIKNIQSNYKLNMICSCYNLDYNDFLETQNKLIISD